MTAKQQHVEAHRKIGIRRRLLDKLGTTDGLAYIPYCGDGDLTHDLDRYDNRRCLLIDNDPDRTTTAQQRFDTDTVHAITADANHYQPPPQAWGDTPFAVADFDAYAYPYQAFREWFANAPLAPRLAVFFTDGQRQAIRRGFAWIEPDGTHRKCTADQVTIWRTAYTTWPKLVQRWLTDHAQTRGYTITDTTSYLRSGVLVYWGAILQHTPTVAAGADEGSPSSRIDTRVKLTVPVLDAVLEHVAGGTALDAAAKREGVSGRAFRKAAAGDARLKHRLDAARAVGKGKGDPHWKFDEPTRVAYLGALQEGKPRTHAARDAGISYDAVREYRAAHPEFGFVERQAQRESNDHVEFALFEAATSGNVRAIELWLTNRSTDRWHDRRRVTLAGDAAAPVEVSLTTEEPLPDPLSPAQHVAGTLVALRDAGVLVPTLAALGLIDLEPAELAEAEPEAGSG